MPCKDTTSRVTVWLDSDERLTGFDFSKITCSKEIGGGTGYLDQCRGRLAEEVLDIEFQDILDRLDPGTTEEQFFLYLEWDALRTSIAQYLGKAEDIDPKRYQIASIAHDEDGITIIQVIRPPEEMPKLVSCGKRERQKAETGQSG